jgi:hypothetical protein
MPSGFTRDGGLWPYPSDLDEKDEKRFKKEMNKILDADNADTQEKLIDYMYHGGSFNIGDRSWTYPDEIKHWQRHEFATKAEYLSRLDDPRAVSDALASMFRDGMFVCLNSPE